MKILKMDNLLLIGKKMHLLLIGLFLILIWQLPMFSSEDKAEALQLPEEFKLMKSQMDQIDASTTLSADVKKSAQETYDKANAKFMEIYTPFNETYKKLLVNKKNLEEWKTKNGQHNASKKNSPSDSEASAYNKEKDQLIAEKNGLFKEGKELMQIAEGHSQKMTTFLASPGMKEFIKAQEQLLHPSPNFNEKLAMKQLKAIANRIMNFDNSIQADSTKVIDARNAGVPVKNMPAEIKNSPGVREARKGYQCMESKDWAAAKAWFQQALLKDPTNESLKKQVALCDQKMKEKK